jgi:uncharacterized protein (UPF0297 family)
MDKLFGYDTSQSFDYENGFYITSDRRRLQKLIAHYELYKKIIDLPGQVVECGVFKGASLIRFAQFRDMLESVYSRQIIGFDAFGKFPVPNDAASHNQQSHRNDLAFIKAFEREAGEGISMEELYRVFKHKHIDNIELIAGDILQTIPDYVKQHPELRIALLHIDVDVYQPTKLALECFYDCLVPGGIIVFDDYGTVYGETIAVDEFFKEKLKLKKLSCSHIPSYFVKEY